MKNLFLIGDKSRHFYNDELFNFVEVKRVDIGIEDYDKSTLEHIFNFFNEIITRDKKYITDFL